jgi:hypothetical protein
MYVPLRLASEYTVLEDADIEGEVAVSAAGPHAHALTAVAKHTIAKQGRFTSPVLPADKAKHQPILTADRSPYSAARAAEVS